MSKVQTQQEGQMGSMKSMKKFWTNGTTKAAAAVFVVLASPAARAAGLLSFATNGRMLVNALISVLVVLAVLVGLAFIFKGLQDAYAKNSRGNDDITWGSISTKIFAGAFLMVISWLGAQVTETFGASAANIGSSF